jgi:hypothetical protein
VIGRFARVCEARVSIREHGALSSPVQGLQGAWIPGRRKTRLILSDEVPGVLCTAYVHTEYAQALNQLCLRSTLAPPVLVLSLPNRLVANVSRCGCQANLGALVHSNWK